MIIKKDTQILRVKPNAIDSEKIRWHAIETEDMDTGSITSRIIKDGTIQGKDISENANLEIQSLAVSDGLVSAGPLQGITLDTGQGAYELYAMDQNVLAASAPTFAGLTLNGNLILGANTLTTTNTTLISNLNADLLDGQHGSYYAPLGNISGTANYLSKFTGSSSLGNSLLYDNGTNVGIGTTTLASKLGVLGNLAIGATYGALAAPTSGMIIEGNVGIGDASPGTKLSVKGASPMSRIWDTAGTNHGILQFTAGDVNTIDSNGELNSTTPLAFLMGGVEKVRIQNNGDVGIGTASPIAIGGGYIGLTIAGDDTAGRGGYLSFMRGATVAGQIISNSAALTIDTSEAKPLIFSISGVPKVTINSSGGIVAYGTVGSFSGVGRVDAQIEIQNNGTGHAMWSSVLNQNPGNITNENAWSGQAYNSAGALVQQGAFYMRWQDTNETNGYSVVGMHPNYFNAGSITADVAFEVYGGHGIGMFLGPSATPPTDRYLMIKRTGNRPSIVGTADLVLDANYGGSADNVFLNGYNAGNVVLAFGGGKVGIGTVSPGTAGLAIMNGNVGIGTTSPDTTLKVVGSICAKATDAACFGTTAGNIYAANFIVDGTYHLPDYVFEPNYSLLPISDLENYLTLHKHLPGVPSASEVNQDGLNLGLMVPAILEKTEENTLYIIQNNDQLANQESLIMNQNNQILNLGLSVGGTEKTIKELEIYANEKLTIVGEKLNELTAEDAALNTKIANLEARLPSTPIEDMAATLQSQVDEIKAQNETILSFLSVTDGKLDLMKGTLEAEGVVAGAFTVKVVDKERKTIGDAVICATGKIFKAGSCGDPLPGEIASDGKTIEIKTKAVGENSKIYLTPISSTNNQVLYVGEITAGEKFQVKIDRLEGIMPRVIEFNWWIVESR